MLPSEFIREKIVQAFNDLAEAFSDGTVEIPCMTEDEEAGIPMMIFTAQQTMLVAWQSYLSGHASAPRRLTLLPPDGPADQSVEGESIAGGAAGEAYR